MRDTWPLLEQISFPPIRRGRLDTLQVNVGYRCNQTCVHCHVDASPYRTEEMSAEVVGIVLAFLERQRVATLDITGGAPELNPHFRTLVSAARALGVRVMDRCNLTILEEPGQEDLAAFLAREEVEIVASMPCYLEDNVDRQRGKGVFDSSIRALQRLNALGYGREGSKLTLNLVYNPQGPALPPPQEALEADYKRVLGERYGIVFNQLFTLANMPIKRFGAMLMVRASSNATSTPAGAHRDQSRCRDVPQLDLGRLARLRLRLRLQPDARSAARTRRPCAHTSPTHPPTSKAGRSVSFTATAGQVELWRGYGAADTSLAAPRGSRARFARNPHPRCAQRTPVFAGYGGSTSPRSGRGGSNIGHVAPVHHHARARRRRRHRRDARCARRPARARRRGDRGRRRQP
jgi:radical SAM/Cys-rich protein